MPDAVWYRSLYWRIAFGFVALLAAILVVQVAVFVWLTVVVAQFLQTLMLGGWLWWRSPDVVVRTLRAWRVSLFAGFMGAAASAAWFSAFAIQSVTYVRTLGLTEMLFSYVVSRRVFRERLTRREIAGMVLIVAGVVVITLA